MEVENLKKILELVKEQLTNDHHKDDVALLQLLQEQADVLTKLIANIESRN